MLRTPSRLRARGFAPAEVSALLQAHVVQRHADEAAFLWRQRRAAATAPHYRLEHLAKLDERLAAHLEGLRVAGAFGGQVARARLADGDPGAVFVAAWLAFADREPASMRDALALGLADAAYLDATEEALCWLDAETVAAPVHLLLASPHPQHRRLGLQVAAAQRLDVGTHLDRLLEDPNPPVRAAALSAAGELARRDLAVRVAAHRSETDVDCRYGAARSSVLLGVAEAPAALLEATRVLPQHAAAATQLAIRWADASTARDWIRSFAAAASTRRLAIQMAGAYGDPRCTDWLVEQMRDPVLARVAGEAFSSITGADLRYLDLDLDAPEEAPAGACVEDEDLPWPQAEAASTWWQQTRTSLPTATRLLCGQPLSSPTAASVLQHGYQRQRHAAALEYLRLGGPVLFPVRQRADRQRRLLPASLPEIPCASPT